MKKFSRIPAICILLFQLQQGLAQSNDVFIHQIMNGLSNKGQHTNKAYLCAADRIYIVGTQDADFPDLGAHVPGEMGGLWMQPVKLLDGLWIKISEGKSQTWLENARE